MPPHVWHSPLPWQAEHGAEYLNAFEMPGISSAGILPFPWHTEQFPSPAESQSGQVWVAILHLPTLSAILIWLRTTVKGLVALHPDELCDLIFVVQIPQGFEFHVAADAARGWTWTSFLFGLSPKGVSERVWECTGFSVRPFWFRN